MALEADPVDDGSLNDFRSAGPETGFTGAVPAADNPEGSMLTFRFSSEAPVPEGIPAELPEAAEFAETPSLVRWFVAGWLWEPAWLLVPLSAAFGWLAGKDAEAAEDELPGWEFPELVFMSRIRDAVQATMITAKFRRGLMKDPGRAGGLETPVPSSWSSSGSSFSQEERLWSGSNCPAASRLSRSSSLSDGFNIYFQLSFFGQDLSQVFSGFR